MMQNKIGIKHFTVWGMLMAGLTLQFPVTGAINSMIANAQVEVAEEVNVLYENKFSDEANLPSEGYGQLANLEGVSIESEMLKFQSKFDGGTDWGKNQHGLNFNLKTPLTETIASESTITFDVLVPTDKADFSGEFKFKVAAKDSEWTYVGGADSAATSDKFEDLGEGYSKYTVSLNIASEIKGLKAISVEVISYECDYTDVIYLDNITMTSPKEESEEPQLPDVDVSSWDFNEGLQNWSNGGAWSYAPGAYELSHETSVQDGALKLDLDFSENKETGWSEVKISQKSGVDVTGYNKLTYDFIYNPAHMTTGMFKTKVWATGNAINKDTVIDTSKVEDLGDGLKKVQVTVEFAPTKGTVDDLTIGIIGSMTDYKGAVYVDNIKLEQDKPSDGYVEITMDPTHQALVDANTISGLYDSSYQFVDGHVSKETASLYGYLMGVGKSDKVIFGHQNDTHKIAGAYSGSKDYYSDSKLMTGSISGIVGIDTLSFTGDEGESVDYAANVSIAAAKEGGILTLSSHMPNFEVVKNKPRLADGSYDFQGYSPGITSGNIVKRIMPDGDLNEVYTAYLDLIADYGHQLDEQGVPVLFRPLHENNGSWFWWGAAYCDAEAYKNLYRYTVEYLRDEKEVHNFLYVYSPNGPFTNEEAYLDRYPGDAFIDVIAFDMYHDKPTATDNWMDSLSKTLELIEGIAADRGKLAAFSEVGMRVKNGISEGIAKSGNTRPDWYNEVLDVVSQYDIPYFMVWANFNDEGNFYMPYKVTDTTGHEMINNFIDFYNDERSIFADSIDYSKVNISAEEQYNYAFFTAPNSGARILEPTKISAQVNGAVSEVSFVLKDRENNVLETLQAKTKSVTYEAVITQEILDKIGEVNGVIELVVDGEILNSINVIFNIKEFEPTKDYVDDFEYYYGNEALLTSSWTANKGPNCLVDVTLTDTTGQSLLKTAMAFNYKISNALTNEGWAGVTKALNTDWSDYDALQLWIKPDGNAQKLVVQVTSMSEDFEVQIPEFAATKEPQLLTIPFSSFVGKNGGEFNSSHISRVGIWMNTIVPEGHEGTWEVDSTIYIDEIRAVNTAQLKPTIEVADEVAEEGVVNQSITLPTGQVNSYDEVTYNDYDMLQLTQSEAQIIVKDPSNNVVTMNNQSFIPTQAGVYTVTYTSADKEQEVTYDITVTKEILPPVADKVAPVITLVGDQTIKLTVGETYKELGASAVDNVDGEVKVTISGEVNTQKAGTYTVTYTATDKANNKTTVTRTVIVMEANDESGDKPQTGLNVGLLVASGLVCAVAGSLILISKRQGPRNK